MNTGADSAVVTLLTSIQDQVGQIKLDLQSHIENTKTQFDILHDELFSMKKCVTVNGNITQNKMEILTESSFTVQNETQKTSEMVQRRLSTIFDSLKSLHNKNAMNQPTRNSVNNTDYSISTQTSYAEVGTNKQTENEVYIIEGQNSLPIKTNSKDTNIDSVSTASLQQTTSEKAKIVKKALSTPTNQTAPKTMIIGDSILKGINKRGLSENTDAQSIRGAKVKNISFSIRNLNPDGYATFVIYVGGNDVGSADTQAIYSELKETVTLLKQQNNDVYLCTVCPRSDCDVVPLNESLKQLSRDQHVNLIDIYSSFIYGDGTTARNYYLRDGIHLNNMGTRNLVSCINRVVPIIKLKTTPTIGLTRNDIHTSDRSHGIHNSRNSDRDFYCDYCRMRNHNTRDCWRIYRSTGYGRNMHAADGYAQDGTWSTSTRYRGSAYRYNKHLDNSDGYNNRRMGMR